MKRLLKGLAYAVGGLVVLLLVAGATLYVLGGRKLGRTYHVQPARLTLPADSTALARGAHLALVYGCHDCHGADLGGQVLADAPPFRATASNLTRGEGGIGRTYSDADWDRAVRHGVKPDGRGVLIMPSTAYHGLADTDFAALVAYLKRAPPVDRELPPTEVRPLGRLLAAGPMDPAAEVDLTPTSATAPPVGPTAAYGAYLVSTGCTHCHGADLRGAQPPNPDSPPAPDLTALAATPVAELARILRTGVLPDGRRMDPAMMPWTATRHMTDDEIAALHAHLGALGGAAGARPAAGA